MVKKAGIAFLSFLLFCSLFTFGMTFWMKSTILSPEFAIAQIDRLDMSALAEEVLKERMPLGEVVGEMEFVREALDDVIADLEPWIKEQTHTAVHAGYDYLLGKSENLNIVIDMRPMKDNLRESLWQAVSEAQVPMLELVPPAELGQLFDQFYGEFAEQIPATIEITESMINAASPEIRGMQALDFGRWFVSQVQLAYRISIGAMIGIIVGLIFLHRRVKGAARSIGIPCLVSGILAFVGTMVARYFIGIQMAQFLIPAYLHGWLQQFISDLLAPLRMYGIGLMATGITLLVVSFVYKRRQPSAEQS